MTNHTNATYDLRVSSRFGTATVKRCRFDDPTRAILRALDTLSTLEAFPSAARETFPYLVSGEVAR